MQMNFKRSLLLSSFRKTCPGLFVVQLSSLVFQKVLSATITFRQKEDGLSKLYQGGF